MRLPFSELSCAGELISECCTCNSAEEMRKVESLNLNNLHLETKGPIRALQMNSPSPSLTHSVESH